MRTYKEQTAYIFEKYEQQEKNKRKRQKAAFCVFVPVACFVFMAAVFFTPLKSAKDNYGLPPESTSSAQTQITAPMKTSEKNNGTTIYFNKLESLQSDNRIKLNFDKTYEKKLTDEEAFAYLGKNILPAWMPDNLKYAGDISPDAKHTIYYNNDGTIYFDQLWFSYSEEFENYNPLAKKLNIVASKIANIQNDCVYIWSEDMIVSEINGIKIMIGSRQMPYGPYTIAENGPNIPAGYYDLFVAEFQYDGIYYQITTDNFTQDEFLKTIESMIPEK